MSDMVEYLGRVVPKSGFRTFIYGANCQKKLVSSWDEFTRHMASGVWFACIEDIGKQDEPKALRKKGRV